MGGTTNDGKANNIPDSRFWSSIYVSSITVFFCVGMPKRCIAAGRDSKDAYVNSQLFG